VKRPSFKRIFIIIFILLVLPVFAAWILIAQPAITKNAPSNLTIDSARLKAHVVKFSEAYFPRSFKNIENLDRCAEYIQAHFKKAGAADLPVYSVNAPLMVTGIDYSDHRSYWEYGYNAVMITDTAFYRNLEYHTPSDTADRLNYELMAKAVVQVFEAVKGLATENLPDAGD
jgi:hypothetical protein